jgi:pilus assembly protein CpaE
VALIANNDEGPRGALQILLAGDDDDRRHEVRRVLGELADPPLEIFETGWSDPNIANGTGPPDVVMLLFSPEHETNAINYLERRAGSPPRPALFALMAEPSPALMRRILRAGADELLSVPLSAADAACALLKISETRRRQERQKGGVVVSVVSAVGGAGVTSLVGNLAMALRYTLNRRVAAVDLDLQSGGLAVFLNVEPDHTIVQLCELDRRLDSIQLESTLTKHPTGIYLLAAPKRIEDCELVYDKTVGIAIDLMRRLFDFVIVDCGRHIDENVVTAWERSDFLFYVLNQSIVAARSAWRFLDLFGRLRLPGLEPAFVIGSYQPHHPISAAQMAHTLGQPILAKIPRDEKVLEQVQVSGRDLWQVGQGSPLLRAIEALAKRLAEGEPAAEPRTRIVSRLLSVFAGLY